MNDIKVILNKNTASAVLPQKAKGDSGNAGYDLYAIMPETIRPFERKLIKTGLKLEIPPGYYGRIAPRSGLAFKQGIDVMAGVIDSNYRDEVGVILINLNGRGLIERLIRGLGTVGASIADVLWGTSDDFKINPGDRIAQIIFERAYAAEIVEGDLSQTNRDGGFGSTGVK